MLSGINVENNAHELVMLADRWVGVVKTEVETLNCEGCERVDRGHCGKTCRNCGEKHGGSGLATCISDAILHNPPPHPQIACLLPS